MARVPSQKTPFNISDTVAKREFKNGKETFRAYGTDYSELSGHVFYLGSAPLERYIAFKAFFEELTINLTKDSKVDNNHNRNYQVIVEESGKMSIDISLILPAHSTNEAMNNLAKIEELQKLIMPGKWSAGDNSMREKNANLDYTFEGVSERTRLTTPLFHAYFKNIINSGRKNLPKRITDYSQLITHGFPCYIDNVKYEPQVDEGYFEFDDYLFPKVIRLKLTLNYESETLFDDTNPDMAHKALLPFTLKGHFSQYDSSLFPFGIKVTFNESKKEQNPVHEPHIAPGKMDFSIKEMNDIGSSSSFVFISMPINPSGETPYRYVKFKPFIDDFTRTAKTEIKLAHNAGSTIHSRVLQHGVTPSATEYTLKINIPSRNLAEAKKNCGKIQYLMRMFFKKYSNGLEAIIPGRDDLRIEDLKQKLMVYVPSMIEMPNAGAVTNDVGQMFENAVPLYLKDMKFEMDMESGFFESNNNVFPKVMSLNLDFIYNRADMIRNYNMRKGGGNAESNGQTYYVHKPNEKSRQPIISSSEAHLFPFARKTSKVGDPK